MMCVYLGRKFSRSRMVLDYGTMPISALMEEKLKSSLIKTGQISMSGDLKSSFQIKIPWSLNLDVGNKTPAMPWRQLHVHKGEDCSCKESMQVKITKIKGFLLIYNVLGLQLPAANPLRIHSHKKALASDLFITNRHVPSSEIIQFGQIIWTNFSLANNWTQDLSRDFRRLERALPFQRRIMKKMLCHALHGHGED